MRKLRLWIVGLEFFALLSLFTGAVWRAEVSGWWQNESDEWQFYIQHEVNLALLDTFKDIARLETTTDSAQRDYIYKGIRDRLSHAFDTVESEKKTRDEAMDTGQGGWSLRIESVLMGLGAILLVAAKGVSWRVECKYGDSRPRSVQAET